MPDVYGNKTPQEVIQEMQYNSRKYFQQAQASGSPGVQAGASLAAIFGGPIKKTIDTRQARKAEVTRLMKTQGMSEEQAWEQARATVGREHAEVRKAKVLQQAAGEVPEFIANLPAEVPSDMKNAYGMLFLSDRMRSLGMNTEATNLSVQANELIAKAEQAALERENLKARTRASTVGADLKEAQIPYVGVTDFQKNILERNRILARLEDPNSQLTKEERDRNMYAKGMLEAKIIKDSTLIGRTEEDVRADVTLARKLFADVADNNVLVANIDESLAQLGDLSNFDETFWATATKDLLGFLHSTFGRRPSESEAEFMKRVQEKEGMASLIAAKVRHALTGAQMSAFEIGYLTPFLPSPDDDVNTIRNKLGIVRAYTQLDTDIRMQMFQQGMLATWASGIPPVSVSVRKKTSTTAPVRPGDDILDEALKNIQGQGNAPTE